MGVLMRTTTRLACVAIALAAGACGSAKTPPLTPQQMITADPLPLAKGAQWTYDVTVKRYDPDTDKEVTKTLTWTTQVVDAKTSPNGLTAYLVKGWPSDLASMDQAPVPTERTILRSGNNFLFGGANAWTDPTLDDAEGWFSWPVLDGQKICPKASMVYCWQVSAVPSGYDLSFYTGPDEQTFELDPGTGIARFHYAHHGTTDEVEAKLVSYSKGSGS